MTQDPTRPLVWPATLAELTARFGAMLEAAGSLETGEFEAAALAREAVAAYRRWLRAEMEKLIMVMEFAQHEGPAVAADLDALCDAAVAAYRAHLRAEVEGLTRLSPEVNWTGSPFCTSDDGGRYLDRAAVLALLEEPKDA